MSPAFLSTLFQERSRPGLFTSPVPPQATCEDRRSAIHMVPFRFRFCLLDPVKDSIERRHLKPFGHGILFGDEAGTTDESVVWLRMAEVKVRDGDSTHFPQLISFDVLLNTVQVNTS